MNGKRIVAIGAHPDDIEFGCGAFLLDAVDKGAMVTLVVLSKGEAGTQGDGSTREVEAQYAATLLGATLHFVDAGGDTGIRANLDTTLTLAKEIRRLKPDILLAPTGHLNQHPDHREANVLVRDAHRLARYGKTHIYARADAQSPARLLQEGAVRRANMGDRPLKAPN